MRLAALYNDQTFTLIVYKGRLSFMRFILRKKIIRLALSHEIKDLSFLRECGYIAKTVRVYGKPFNLDKIEYCYNMEKLEIFSKSNALCDTHKLNKIQEIEVSWNAKNIQLMNSILTHPSATSLTINGLNSFLPIQNNVVSHIRVLYYNIDSFAMFGDFKACTYFLAYRGFKVETTKGLPKTLTELDITVCKIKKLEGIASMPLTRLTIVSSNIVDITEVYACKTLQYVDVNLVDLDTIDWEALINLPDIFHFCIRGTTGTLPTYEYIHDLCSRAGHQPISIEIIKRKLGGVAIQFKEYPPRKFVP